jgi:hypothetical protein
MPSVPSRWRAGLLFVWSLVLTSQFFSFFSFFRFFFPLAERVLLGVPNPTHPAVHQVCAGHDNLYQPGFNVVSPGEHTSDEMQRVAPW